MIRRPPLDPRRVALQKYYTEECGIKKPELQARTDAREDRQESEKDAKVRAYVFARERNICRCCRSRTAESRHELRFKSLGGKVTRQNCVAVCGDGVRGCHGMLQDHSIAYDFEHPALGAESTVIFTAKDRQAAEWLRIEIGESISSQVMVETEISA